MIRVLLVFVGLLSALPTTATAESYPLDQWARRAAISNIQISPDGRRLAAILHRDPWSAAAG